MTKTVAIIGATGLQGGSVLKTLHASGKYNIVALTRNPSGQSAKVLLDKYPGIKLAAADLNDTESLRNAFKGADAVFGVTQFFQKDVMDKVHAGDTDAEYNQGKNMVDAAIAAGVKDMVYSSLDSIKRISNGKYPNVLHFEGKYRIQEYLLSKAAEIRGYIVQAGSYMENYVDAARISPEDSTTVEFSFPLSPETKLPLVDTANDTGAVVEYVLEHPDECQGTVFEISGGYYEVQDMVKAFTEVTGKPARYVQIPYEYIPSEELQQMFKGLEEFGPFDGKTEFIARNKKINYKFTTPTEFWKNRGWTGPTAASSQ
ncbi:hypothetical protein LPJ57_003460 [Coemansia sp. RSA 486]|nr:hypothetical protein LPJ57_003460 [Coemansia sp. RSA 486]KAJ2229067.1 hypothetical protein IWW45_006353 [Coemansia sp. RSA 485]